jgi:beta-xylosidase
MMGENGVPLEEVTVNLPPQGRDYVWDNDEFESAKLALVWQWNHKAPEGWSLTERPGWLRLRAALATGLADARGTLTQRTVGPRCISEVHLDGSAMQPGDAAGLCAFQSRSARIGLEIQADGKRCLVVREREQVLFRQAWDRPDVYLRIRYVFTPVDAGDQADTAFLSWSADGVDWQEWDRPLQMRYTLDYFTGYRSGLYNYATLLEGGAADFDDFRQWVY